MKISTEVYPYICVPTDKDSIPSAENLNMSAKTYYYLKIFSNFHNELKYRIKWNWSAALFGVLWLTYRKMYTYAVGLFILEIFSSFFVHFLLKMNGVETSKIMLNIITLAVVLLRCLLLGLYGNQLYIHFISQNISKNKISKKNVSGFSVFVAIILILASGVFIMRLPHLFS